MAIRRYSFRNDPDREEERPAYYWVLDTEAEMSQLPTPLTPGDRMFTKNTEKLWLAKNTTTWLDVTPVLGTGGLDPLALTTHNLDTTGVHGITNTANLVLTDDTRLTNARTPTAHGHPFSEITGTAATGQIPTHDILTKHTFPGGSTFLRADGTWATPSGGGGGPTEAAVVLGSNHANTTTTPGAVTGLAATLAPGTWLAKYWLVYQTAATTTGIQMYLDHTGTTTRMAGTWYQLTTGGAAATGIGDQATTLTAQMLEGKGQRADNVATGPTQGVDTANADEFAVYEALIVVTASGTLNLMMNSEVAGSAATIMSGSTLALTKVA